MTLFKKQLPEEVEVGPDSAALFRFGEQCNYRCPMCSNTGDPSLFFHKRDELLRRAAFLHAAGFRRVVVTGGEATIHPDFWTVVEWLGAHGICWDANTHGRSFAKNGFAQRAVGLGLERAIVSLHSLDPKTSAEIFGVREGDHHATVVGVQNMVEAGVDVMLNCVLNRLNLLQLDSYLRGAIELFGAETKFKFVFPTTIGKGGAWEGIVDLRYDDVRESVLTLKDRGRELAVEVSFESFPNCILAEPNATNYSRSTFGESHYLDDATGDRVYSMHHIEAELSAYGEACRECTARRHCPGIAYRYAKRHGVGELSPFGPGDQSTANVSTAGPG